MYAGIVWMKSSMTSLALSSPEVSPTKMPAGIAMINAMSVELRTKVSVLIVSDHKPIMKQSHRPTAATIANVRPMRNHPATKTIPITAQ
ncbi:hypothetical protein D3C87_1751220 [compost metagenome]